MHRALILLPCLALGACVEAGAAPKPFVTVRHAEVLRPSADLMAPPQALPDASPKVSVKHTLLDTRRVCVSDQRRLTLLQEYAAKVSAPPSVK